MQITSFKSQTSSRLKNGCVARVALHITQRLADVGEFNNKKNNSKMINSTIELPKITADFPAPVLQNPMLAAVVSSLFMVNTGKW